MRVVTSLTPYNGTAILREFWMAVLKALSQAGSGHRRARRLKKKSLPVRLLHTHTHTHSCFCLRPFLLIFNFLLFFLLVSLLFNWIFFFLSSTRFRPGTISYWKRLSRWRRPKRRRPQRPKEPKGICRSNVIWPWIYRQVQLYPMEKNGLTDHPFDSASAITIRFDEEMHFL